MLTRDFKFRVWYKDTDQMGIVHHSNYICYYEAARSELLRSFGSSYADMEEKDGVMMPILEVHSKYLRPAHYDELITVRISSGSCRKRVLRSNTKFTTKRASCSIRVLRFWVSSTAIRGVPAGLRKDLWSCWKKTCNSRCFLRIASRSFRFFPRGRYFGFSSMENPGWEFRTILSDRK